VSPPLTIPDHELLRPIGRGAYGEVWLARNVMGAWRAVKVIGRAQFASERPYEREFEGIRRFEPVSRSSGGLVHVLHVGRNDAAGYYYYVMELADAVARSDGRLADEPALGEQGEVNRGQTWVESYSPRTLKAELRQRERLETAQALRVALEVASGLAQLHRHGLVHRDVKPGNIIFVNGRAKLADIGLVSARGEGRTFVGTEGYVPPEGPGTPAADIYALGIALYEATTGFAPERFPYVPPEWFTGAVGEGALELHEVILKACEGRREHRYRSVDELQADLLLLQSGQSVRRVRALERRYARLRLSGIAGTALLVCALVGWLLADYRARVAAENRAKENALRQQAELAQGRAERAEQDGRRQLYAALLEQAKATVRSEELGQRFRALEAIGRAASISNSAELRGAAISAMALPDMRFERRLACATNTTMVQLDPGFERVAICRGTGPVEIRGVAGEQILARLPASTGLPAYAAQWSRDGRYLAVKRDHPGPGERRDLEVWDAGESRLVLSLRGVEHGAAAFHPRLPLLLAGELEGEVGVWDLERTNKIGRFRLAGAPSVLAFSPDGEQFAAVEDYAGAWLVSVHEAGDGRMLLSRTNVDLVQWMEWDPRGRWIGTADHGGAVQLMDARSGELRTLGRHKAQAVLAVFNPDGTHLLSGGWEREMIYWDVGRMERAFTIALNSYRAQFRADGRECAIISNDEVQLLGVEGPAGLRGIDGDLGPRLKSGAFSGDGRWLAASASQQLGVWDLAGEGPPALDEQARDAQVFFSPTGELLASRDDGWFRWRIVAATGGKGAPRLQALELPKSRGFVSICLASNLVVLTGEEGSRVVGPGFEGEGGWARTVSGVSGGSPDGRWLGIFQPYSDTLRLYGLPELKEAATLTNRASIGRLDFSPMGSELAISSLKGIEIWSTARWERVGTLANFVSMFYAPDGRACWLARDSRTAGLYDARTFDLLLPLPVGTLPLAASPDGRFLAVSVEARRLQVWDLSEVRALLAGLGLDWPR